MKKIFTKTDVHGELYFNAIYDYFDGPKLFSLINGKGDLFLCYWIDETDEKLEWIIISITKSRLLKFESKEIDIYDILDKKEDSIFYIVDTFFDKKLDCQILTYIGNINEKIAMPDKGLSVSFTNVLLTAQEVKEIKENGHLLADYSIHIDKPTKSKAKIDFRATIPSFDIIEEFYTEFLSSFKQSDKLIPVAGKPGSFILDFNAKKFSLAEPILIKLSDYIKNRADLDDLIKNERIPSQSLEKLFNHIIDNDVIIDISNKHSDKVVIKIDKNDAEFYIKKLNKIAQLNVTSQQVPQADTLEKVYSVVENIWRNGFLVRETLDLSPRHILYYFDACKILGLISESNSITSVGQQLVLSDIDKKHAIVAQCFENSHCGWTWVTWSEVTSITEVNPETAKAFLNACAPTLSQSTRDRRARTLRTWCRELQEYYRAW
ncbi:Uncharacterised protein [Enterobacter hormaechei]|uniref:DUF6575 domain-containing protein n=1 Tax=Enterobacter hormaechei TaxID=158836 RepID=UPI0007944EEF|nr:DUF6575 domain-containing protein [Enterobacter hormaechei]CZV06590.1 Uncharacterised protein [Enterobacter hormaechei]